MRLSRMFQFLGPLLHMVRHRVILAASVLASILVGACESTEPMPPRVQFRITDTVGPCSTPPMNIRFFLDGALLAEEEFVINSRPGGELSSQFPVPAGTHTLGARVAPNGFAWPDTTVTLVPNQLFVRTIDFYCS
jgi:hypothetical protein